VLANAVLLLLVSAAWASGYVFISAAGDLPPITASALMTLIAALVIVPALRLGARKPLVPTLRQRPWVPLLMGLTAIALPNLSVVVAEHSVPADLAAVIGTTVPISTFLLATFVTRQERYSHGRMLGALIALIGLIIFVGWRDLLAGGAELQGILIMMSGGLVFAVSGLLVASQTRDMDASVLAAWTIVFAGVYLSVAALIFEEPLSVNYAPAVWALVGEGVLGMGIAYLAYFLLIARAGASFATMYAFLVPPLGMIAASVVFDEPLTPAHLIGITVVLAGMALIRRR
jgi:drug/metabolite transporter (DMT)-like permease